MENRQHPVGPDRERCSGAVLVGIIAAVIMMGLLGAGVLMLVLVSSTESLQTADWNQAFFAAESGLSKTRAYIATNTGWRTNLPYISTGRVGRASFSNVIETRPSPPFIVRSTGIQNDSRWTSYWAPPPCPEVLLLAYRQGNEFAPRYRTLSSLKTLSSETNANSVFRQPEWQRLAANPRTNEFILVSQNNQRWIYAQVYTNGHWSSVRQMGRTTTAAARTFDVAYENLSGRGMVVYGDGTFIPKYQVWNSSGGWSAPQSLTNIGASGIIQWVRLVSKPGTNEIMCLARWRRIAAPANNYSSAVIWNGSVWTNPVTLETNCNASINYETMDAAYSAAPGSNSALVVYVNGPSSTQQRYPKYRTYNGTNGTWSAQNTMAVLGNVPRWIRVEYSSRTNPLAYAAFLHAGTRLQGAYWTTNGWSGYNNFNNSPLEINTRRCFDIAWSPQIANALMVVYSRQNQNAQSYHYAVYGGGSSNYGSLVSTDDGQWSVLKADPFSSEFYYLALDDRNDVNFQRWDGSSWRLFSELEDNSSATYCSIDLAFRCDSAVTNTSW